MGRPAKPKVDEKAAAAWRMAKLSEVARCARVLLTWLRHTNVKGHYLIPPACVLALCQAVDEADQIATGGE